MSSYSASSRHARSEEPRRRAPLFGDADDEPTGLAPAYKKARSSVADEYARKQVDADERRMAHLQAQQDDEDDALDAFMNAEVLPDVQASAEEVPHVLLLFSS
jgi:hypothetical protein